MQAHADFLQQHDEKTLSCFKGLPPPKKQKKQKITRNPIFTVTRKATAKTLRENRREGRVVFERKILAKTMTRDKPALKSGGVRTWMGDHLQTEAVVPILLFSIF